MWLLLDLKDTLNQLSKQGQQALEMLLRVILTHLRIAQFLSIAQLVDNQKIFRKTSATYCVIAKERKNAYSFCIFNGFLNKANFLNNGIFALIAKNSLPFFMKYQM